MHVSTIIKFQLKSDFITISNLKLIRVSNTIIQIKILAAVTNTRIVTKEGYFILHMPT